YNYIVVRLFRLHRFLYCFMYVIHTQCGAYFSLSSDVVLYIYIYTDQPIL
uniref:Uncharacterized protein n=1 Tax=Ciona savignyi TaxID=51511 RepID=H2Z2E1_CIOSA